MNNLSREDVDRYFFDPDGEIEDRMAREDRWDHDDWQMDPGEWVD